MEKLVLELKKIINFKDTTTTGDIVLLAGKNPQMLVYAQVHSIERDTSRKDEWWQVGMTVLTMPPHETVWTLRTAQMTGMEVFTMGGEERFVKAIDTENPKTLENQETTKTEEGKKPVKEGGGSFLKRVK